MEIKNILAGSIPILALIGAVSVQVIDVAQNSRSVTVTVSPGRSVSVRNWNDSRGIEVHVGAFQTIHDTNKDGRADYISGGAMSRIGTFRYTREPTPDWQRAYGEIISKSQVVDIKRSA